MSTKYYTEFTLTDAVYRGGGEFCGVVELSKTLNSESGEKEFRLILARNFDIEVSGISLVRWARLH